MMDRHKTEQLKNQVDELLRHGSPSCVRQANSLMIENFDGILSFALDLTEPKPKPKHTIADNYPAGGLTASEPCMFCKDFEGLQAKNEELKKELEKPPEDILTCKCGWWGSVDQQDALGSECGCCPQCGNEQLIWLSKLQAKKKEQAEKTKKLEKNENAILMRVQYSLEKLGKEATLLLIKEALKESE